MLRDLVGAAASAGPTHAVMDGPFVLAAALAVAAGVVSFASPCVLPLVPGYLSYLVGLVGTEGAAGRDTALSGNAARRASARSSRRGGVLARSGRAAPRRVAGTVASRTRVVAAAALFVAGFTVIFVCEQVLVLGLARTVSVNSEWLIRLGGVVTIVMGMALVGLIRPLQVERRVHARPTGRIVGAMLLGAFFALGWTVCIGPTLTGVFALSYATDWNGSAWRGLFLVLCYCAGLGIPFLLLALGFGWAAAGMGVLRRHSRAIQIVGAVMLMLVGLAMVTGLWSQFVAWLQIRFPGGALL